MNGWMDGGVDVRMSRPCCKRKKEKKNERMKSIHASPEYYVVEATAGPTNAVPVAAARGAHRTFLLPSEYRSDTVPAPRMVTIVCLRQTYSVYSPSAQGVSVFVRS